ncbi:MAG: hypothetical protein K2Y05_03975 [Hyphomicrobiaceae bacterium]|nr:hypothetical protein [Hyphomicrobiaceae bacterium]
MRFSKIRTARTFALIAAIVAPGVALAHHGWSSFDTAKVLDHTGDVVRSTYANPHGTVFMTRDGKEITVELAPVSRMEARGLAEADIAPGKTIRVYAYTNRDNPNLFRAEWIEPKGKTRVELR